MIELRLLRSFVAVAETEHVGRAATRLHVSQSPLSRQIRQLEDALGVPLFTRERQRIRLTAAGHALLTPARDLLARAEGIADAVRPSTIAEAARIRIGFVSTALWTGVLLAALRALRARRPTVHVELRHLSTNAQVAALRDGELDLALVHRPQGARDLRERRLVSQPFELACLRSDPLATSPLTTKRLAAASWVTVVTDARSRERWAAAWARRNLAPRVAVEVADLASALALVDAGMGVALLPASQAASAPPSIVFRPLPWLKMAAELWLLQRAGVREELDEEVAASMLEHAVRSPRRTGSRPSAAGRPERRRGNASR